MNKHAQALAKLGKGIPKYYSVEEIEIRKARLIEARKNRWVKKDVKEDEK